MPYGEIYCDRCDFQGTTTVLWGSFKYQFEDGTSAYIERKLGWCSDCNDIRPVEVLPEYDSVNDELEKYRRLLDAERSRGIIGSIHRKMSSRARYHFEHLQESERGMANLLRLAATRRSAPKCLHCSSEDVAEIDMPKYGSDPFDWSLDFLHPGCGGNLRVKDSGGMRISIGNRTMLYSPEGIRLD